MTPRFRQFVILATIATCVTYLIFRVTFTLNLNSTSGAILSISLIIAEAFGVTSVLLFSLQVWDPREPARQPVLPGRTVDVFVPTYNEDPMILRATLEACMRLDYPGRRVYLCDDGGTEARCNHPENGPKARERQAELKAICDELGVTYLTRPKNEHAKAGNLNHAFTETNGEFIIIFDADHVPEPHFISRLIGYFADERLGYIQTPHAFYNFSSFQSRLDHRNRKYWEEGALFYGVIQPGRNRWNCPIFAGSAAMFRRKALEEVGYIALETITEDMHTGMRMNSRGWKSLGISERMVAGQAAPDITTFHVQRLRWGEGNLSIMAYDNPLTMKGLTLAQRFCYIGSMIHWAGGLFKLVIYLTPIVMMLTGVSPVREFTWTLFTLTFVYMAASIFGVQYMSNGYGSVFYGELFAMVNFWTQIRGLSRAIFWRKFQQFIVTSKRGRQSKSIWPFVRPQVILFLLSFLALAWGWARVLYGISDDFFKPIIPTCWIVFHMVLIATCVRRAMWPEDGRFSFRHAVNVAVRYEASDGTTGAGVTIDLNELGLGMVSFQKIPAGTPLRLRLDGGGETIDCSGKVMWSAPVSKPGEGPGKAFRMGLKFDPLPGPVFDAINRVTLQYGVPRLYLEYAEGNRKGSLARWIASIRYGLMPHRYDPRRGYKLPVQVVRSGGEPAWSVTEDLTPTALAVLLSEPLSPRTDVGLTLVSPVGEVFGRARVVRSAQGGIGAKTYHRTVLEFHHLHGDGPNTIQDLVSRATAKKMHDALVPDPKPLRLPILKPAAYASLAACLLIGFQLAAFPIVYRNDMFLRDLAATKGDTTPEQIEQFNQIYDATLTQAYPSTDRLVLLSNCLKKVFPESDDGGPLRDRQDTLALMLASRDRYNENLQIVRLHILDRMKDYAAAEAEFDRLKRMDESGELNESQQREMLLAGARSAYHAGNLDKSIARFHEYLARFPNDKTLPGELRPRDEFAGLLLQEKRAWDVPALYQGIDPGYSGRIFLMSAYAQMQDFEKAAEEARQIQKLRPDDPDAIRLVAEILQNKGQIFKAAALFEQLALQDNNTDPTVRLRLGQVYLQFNRFGDALAQFMKVLEERNPERTKKLNRDPELRAAAQRGFVDAAAGIQDNSPDRAKLTPAVLKLAEGLADQLESEPTSRQPEYLTNVLRLAYVLERFKQYPRSILLLERAHSLVPDNGDVRDQLVGALVAADRVDEALSLMSTARDDPKVRRLLINAFLKKGRKEDFEAAEKEARSLHAAFPKDLDVTRKLADILSWQKKYAESLALFKELQTAGYNDPTLPPLPVRVAEVTLWSGDATEAARLYEALLAKKIEQKELWPGFADAVAGEPRAAQGQLSLVIQIARQPAVTDGADWLPPARRLDLLTRLAWVLTREGQVRKKQQSELATLAIPLLDKAVALAPTVPAPTPEDHEKLVEARRELASVLSAAGRPKQALELYAEIKPLTPADQLRLADIYSHPEVKDWPKAEEAARDYMRAMPTDARGERKLADILSWAGQYKESLELFRKLRVIQPDDAEIPIRIAEVTLWSRDDARALDLFAALLDPSPEEPDLAERSMNGFIDAASGVAAKDGSLTAVQKATVVKVVQGSRFVADDAGRLGRLAWVCFKSGLKQEANQAATRAVGLNPQDPAVRRQLGGVLAAMGDFPGSLQMFAGLALPDPKDQLELANLYTVVHNYAKAEEILKKYVQDHPADPTGLRLLADVYSYNHKYDESLELLEKLWTANPADKELPIRIAEVTLWSGKPTEALAMFTMALEANPDQPLLWPGFLDAASATSLALTPAQTQLAVRVYEKLDLNVAPWTKPAQLGRLGRLLFKVGRETDAREAFDKALTLPLTNPQDRRELAGLLAAVGRPKDAIVLYKGVRITEDDRPALIGIYGAAKEFLSAEREAKALVASRPGDPAAERLLADTLSWKGDNTAALALLDKLLQADPKNLGLLLRTAEVALYAGDSDVAATRFAEVLDREFDNQTARKGFVDATAAAKTITPAQAKLAVRIADNPATAKSDDVQYLYRLAWVLVREELPGKVGALLDRCEALGPTDVKLRKELAGVLAAAGRGQAALRWFGTEATTPEEHLQLANIYASAKDFPQAIRECRAFLSAKPADPKAELFLADLLSWNGDFDEALVRFEKLRRKEPKNNYIPLRIAETTLWANRPNEAVELFTKLLATEPKPSKAVASGLVSAAFEADALPDDALKAAEKVRAGFADKSDDALFLGRLGYVFHRAGNAAATDLFDLAMKVVPADDTGTRRQLGGILAVAGRKVDADTVWSGLPFSARDLDKLAQVYLAVKDFPAAIRVCKSVLEREPGSRATEKLLADVFSYDKQYPVALAIFRRLLRDTPDDPALPVRIAETLVWAGNPAEALKIYEAELKKDWGRPKLVRGLIEAVAAVGMLTPEQVELVVKLYTQVPLTAEIPEISYQARLGRALELAGLTKEANQVFDRVAASDPKEPRVRRDVASVLAAAGRGDAALKMLQGLQLTPEDFLQLAYIATGRKDWPAAEEAVTAYRKAFPNDVKAERLQADVYGWAGKYADALALFAKLRKTDPGDVTIPVRMADTILSSGKPAEAVALLSELPEADFRRTEVQTVFTDAAAAASDLTLAEAKIAVRVLASFDATKSQDPVRLARVAQVMVKIGRVEDARTLLNRAAKLPIADDATRRELAGAMASAGIPKEGLTLFQGVSPTPADKTLMAALYAAAKEWDAAEKLLRDLLAADPDNADLTVQLASILSGKRDYAAAVTLYRRLLERFPGDAGLAVRAGQVLLATDQADEALSLLSPVLAKHIETPSVQTVFVDAAASAKFMTAFQTRLALRLATDPATLAGTDVTHLCRLAWVLIREGSPGPADPLLDRALALAPTELKVRRELAGVLAAAGRGEIALKVFGNEPRQTSDHYELANIYASLKQFKPAIAECRLYLADKPNDLKVERLLADLLSWNRDFDEALLAFERLREKEPKDKSIPIRIAETTLWAYRPNEALDRFTRILTADPNQPKAIPGFVGSAFEADVLSPETLRVADQLQATLTASNEEIAPVAAMAGGVVAGAMIASDTEPLLLARLAYVFQRSKQDEVADRLFTKAYAAIPTGDTRARTEVGTILEIAGRKADADQLRAGLPFSAEDQYAAARIYAALKDYKTAITICREIVRREPGNRKSERLLADCLTWDKQYDEGLIILRKLLRDTPDDPDLPTRIAQTLVWVRKPIEAMVLYRAELDKEWGKPKLVRGFIDAAAAAGKLSGEEAAIVARLYKEVPVIRQITESGYLVRLGRALQLAGLTAEADQTFTRAVAEVPRDPLVRRDMVSVLADAGRLNDALKMFEGITPGPDDYPQLALLFAGRKDWAAAEKSARAYAAAFPNDSAAPRLLADVLSWCGKYGESLALFAKLIAANPGDKELLLRAAEVKQWAAENAAAAAEFAGFLEAGMLPLDQAVRARAGFAAAAAALPSPTVRYVDLAEKLAKELPTAAEDKDPLTAARLAVTLARAGRTRLVPVLADRAAKIVPTDTSGRRELAGILAILGRRQEALALYKGLELRPDDRLALAGLYASAKEFDAAEREARAAVEADPRNPAAARMLGDVLTGKKDFKAAVEFYGKLIAADPDDAELKLRLAEVLLWSGDYPAAAARFATVVATDPGKFPAMAEFIAAVANVDKQTPEFSRVAVKVAETDSAKLSRDVQFLGNIAWVLHRANETATANRYLDAALAIDPQDPQIRKGLAGVLEVVGRRKDALRMYEGLTLDEGDRYRLAGLYAADSDNPKRYELAIEQCRAILEGNPTSAKARTLLADCLSWNGRYRKVDYTESLSLLRELQREYPNDPKFPYRIAQVTLWSQDYETALRLYREILSKKFDQPALWVEYIDAAASSKKWAVEDGELARRINEAVADDPKSETVILSRLAWVLLQFDDKNRVRFLLDTALARNPQDPETRRELAGVLASAGRFREARALYDVLALDYADRVQLAEWMIGENDFGAAERRLRDLSRERPNDKKVQFLLADVLTWGKKYDEAIRLLDKLRAADPTDKTLLGKLTSAYVYGGYSSRALALLNQLLEDNLEQPDLWTPYLNAVAATEAVDPAYRATVERVTARMRAANANDPATYRLIGGALARVGRVDQAITMLGQAVQTWPENQSLRFQYGQVLSNTGRYAEADRQFNIIEQQKRRRPAKTGNGLGVSP